MPDKSGLLPSDSCQRNGKPASTKLGEHQHSMHSPGWTAKINLEFFAGGGHTAVRRKHHGPLAIQRPFYPEGETCHVYLLHPPGGIVARDTLQLVAHCKPGSKVLMTNPGAAKFYRSESGPASVRNRITVCGGMLEWLPQENIFYNGCVAEIHTELQLSTIRGQRSGFIGWDIQCYGRQAGKDMFATGVVINSLSIRRNSELIYIDRLVARGGEKADNAVPVGGKTVLGDKSVYATLVATLSVPPDLNPTQGISKDLSCTLSASALMAVESDGASTSTAAPYKPVRYTQAEADVIDGIRSIIDNDYTVATLVDGLILVRYLGYDSEQAKQQFIKIWSYLRPLVIGLEASNPRIWKT